MPRPLLFYSAWPLGYHNVEAERKALSFAEAGHEVVYVAGVGTRNPRPYSARKLVDRATRKLRERSSAQPSPLHANLRTASLLVAPPRQVRQVERMNVAWLERQLRTAIGPWDEAVAWIRWPTQELVEALRRLQPAVTVYECVDAYRHSPGMTGGWVEVFERAERALVEQADAVVVPSEPLAERFRPYAKEVHLVPHGVEVELFPAPQQAAGADGQVTIGFAGTLDYRLDVEVLRRVAESHPDWRVRLIGPAQESFKPGLVADLSNVTVEPPVPHERLGELLATFDVGIMPYFIDPNYTHMCPVKNMELMAAGKPAVARPTPALDPYRGLLYLADTPDEFVTQLERAIAEDSLDQARERRAVAEANTWDRRLGETRQIVDDLLRR